MYDLYDQALTLRALNHRLEVAKARYPDVFPPGLAPLEKLTDLSTLPVLGKEHCVVERIDFGSLEGGEVVLASGGSAGKPAITVQGREEFLIEGRILADALQHFLPEGRRKWLFVNTIASGGLWGGGYFFFVTSMSHPRMVGVNVCGRPPAEMLALLRRVVDPDTARGLEGLILVGMPPVVTEMAAGLHELAESCGLLTRILFAGGGLERRQARLIRARCPETEVIGYYGTSEANGVGIGAVPFSGGDPGPIRYRVLPDSSILWIQDEETGGPITQAGRPGRLVVTSLYCDGKPFNFAGTFDLVAWVDPGRSFTLRGRAQDQLFVPGVFKIDVRDLLDAVLEACGGSAAQIVVTGARTLLVRVDGPERMLTRDELLGCAVRVAPFREPYIRGGLVMEMTEGTIRSPVGKVSRLVDQRAEEEWVT